MSHKYRNPLQNDKRVAIVWMLPRILLDGRGYKIRESPYPLETLFSNNYALPNFKHFFFSSPLRIRVPMFHHLTSTSSCALSNLSATWTTNSAFFTMPTLPNKNNCLNSNSISSIPRFHCIHSSRLTYYGHPSQYMSISVRYTGSCCCKWMYVCLSRYMCPFRCTTGVVCDVQCCFRNLYLLHGVQESFFVSSSICEQHDPKFLLRMTTLLTF